MLKTWFIAMRPWSFTASFVPVALGTMLAWNEGMFSLTLFLLTLIGGIAMQAGTNLINTWGDYKSGVDTVESAKTCPQLVTGVLDPQDMKMAGIGVFSLAALIGLWLTYLRGWPVLVIGMIGLAGGYCYTAGWSPYKYKGWGSILVFFLMGPLMAWPAYYIQTGQYSWLPVWASLPVAFLVSGILHANDLRDMAADRRAGIKTLALYLGTNGSLVLYYGLYTAAFAFLAGLILLSVLPWTAALPLVLVPVARKMLIQAYDGAKGAAEKMDLLETATAQFHFQFGLLLIIGLVLYPLAGRWHL